MKELTIALALLLSCLIAGCSSTPAGDFPNGYQKPSDNTEETPDDKPGDSDFVVFGYAQPAQWNWDIYKDNIRWDCLTHILLCFSYVNADATLDSGVLDNYAATLTSAAHAHGVKVIGSFRSKGDFTSAVQTEALRETLASNIVAYSAKYGFDGIDIDFEEYQQVGPNNDKLLDLFDRIRDKMKKGMTLSSAVIAGDWVKYGTKWHENFDYINIMSYDVRREDSPGQFASYEDYVSDIEYCHSMLGIPLAKLTGGMPFYGHTWDNLPGTDNAGGITFRNIMEYWRNRDANARNLDQEGNTWYNGQRTIRLKCQYARDKGIGGVMIWQLFQDSVLEDESLLKVVGEASGITGK
ncbi:MAG: glycosyl hydrolase family 18 protein [Candidatus Cryptobacteroides sp.]